VVTAIDGEGKQVGEHPHEKDDHPDNAHPRERGLRFSLAGVQLKFSAVMEASGGLTIPAEGMGGSWIVKLPFHRFPAVPENEFAMLGLARRVGIAVPENRLVPMSDIKGLPEEARAPAGKALAVRHFDRLPGGESVHMEDFAAATVYPGRFGRHVGDSIGPRT
jgi:serine/threonine-protein kinase HipA